MSLSVFLGLKTDPCQGDKTGQTIRTAVMREDWPTLRQQFADMRDPEVAAFYMGMIEDIARSEDWLADIVRSHPGDPVASLLYGSRAISWAWEARGGGLGSSVSRKRWDTFFERLVIAEDALADVIAKNPADANAWWLLMITSRGRQLGIKQTRTRFDQAVRAYPGHLPAYRQMLLALCLKWSGSHEAMHDFARETMLSAPEGSLLGSLVATAHIEHWSYDFSRGATITARYFKSKKVRAELHEAADRSVCHPDYSPRPGGLLAHNEFAMAFSFAGEHSAATRQFRIIKGRVTEFPWRYATESGPWLFRFRRLQSLLLPG